MDKFIMCGFSQRFLLQSNLRESMVASSSSVNILSASGSCQQGFRCDENLQPATISG